MSSTRKSFKQKNALGAFRLAVANVIIGYGPHIERHTRDICDTAHIAELCDQYALMIYLNWLGTKCGFPIYQSAIDRAGKYNENSCLPLLSWASLAERYPFHSYENCILSEQSIRQLFSLLDEQFPTQLEIAGDLYQQIISTPLAFSEGKLLGLSKRSDNRVGGEFYTPGWVADICFEFWQQSLHSHIKDPRSSIYDPSCGSGNFLIAAVRNAKDRGMNSEQILNFVGNSLYGSDVDGRTVDLARLLVLLCAWNILSAQSEFDATDFDVEELFCSLCKNITISDTLISGLVTEGKEYDLVITNPPYISFGSRDQEALGTQWQRLLKEKFPASSEYKIRYSSIFQEIGIARAKPDGQAIFFVPDAFLTGGYYQKLRKYILDNTKIISLSELPEKTMDGVTVGRWCIAQYQKKSHKTSDALEGQNNAIKTYSVPAINTAASSHLRQEEFTADSRAENITLRSFASCGKQLGESNPVEFHIPLAVLVSKEKNRFQLIFSKPDQEIFEACRDMGFLNRLLQGRTGIRARAGQQSVIAPHPTTARHRPGIVSGSELRQYAIQWSGHFIEINPQKLFAGGFDEEVISNPKILVRQTGDSIIAAIDNAGLYHLNNVHSFSTIKKPVGTKKKRSEENAHAVQGKASVAEQEKLLLQLICLMNSSFYRHFYGLKTREQKMALAQIDIETVEHMPLPDGFETNAAELVELSKTIKEENDILHSKDTGKKADRAHELAISQALSKVDKIIFELFEISIDQQEHIAKALGTEHSRVLQ